MLQRAPSKYFLVVVVVAAAVVGLIDHNVAR
jgi:hypothetical protein